MIESEERQYEKETRGLNDNRIEKDRETEVNWQRQSKTKRQEDKKRRDIRRTSTPLN